MSKQKQILIVDDERTITDSLVKIFESVGYKARGVYSAEQAKETLESWIPDLAIIDVHLPNMSGIDLAILLKEEYPTCRLMLFSGRPQTSELLETALKCGHTFEILAKPVHPTELLDWAACRPQKSTQESLSN